jgi:hypothetical protein
MAPRRKAARGGICENVVWRIGPADLALNPGLLNEGLTMPEHGTDMSLRDAPVSCWRLDPSQARCTVHRSCIAKRCVPALRHGTMHRRNAAAGRRGTAVQRGAAT